MKAFISGHATRSEAESAQADEIRKFPHASFLVEYDARPLVPDSERWTLLHDMPDFDPKNIVVAFPLQPEPEAIDQDDYLDGIDSHRTPARIEWD